MEVSSEVDPPLTTVKIDMERIGQESINKIIEIIKSTYEGPIKTIIDNEIAIRNSCRAI